jgi:hypothetical protein
MGGIFMYKKVLTDLVIFLSGYLLIKWITIPHPFVLSEFFIGLVINPLKFFIASVVFFIGFLVTGKVIRELLHRTREMGQKREKLGMNLFLEYLFLFFIFFLLFKMGWEQNLVFFSFSLFYGMISIEL